MLKRIVLVAFIAVLILGAGGYAFYQLSPWPSVWLIRYEFAKGDEAARDSAAPFVPAGMRVERGLVYDPQSSDARFDLFAPAAAKGPLPAIVWVHGGGFVAGSRESVGNYLQVLAARGYVGIAIDYTRAPEAGFPIPVRQTNTALAHLMANADRFNIDPTRIFLMGDSAGASIVAQTALTISEPAYAKRIGVTPALPRESLRGLVLYCGFYNPALVEADSPFANFNRIVIWSYLGTKDAQDPRILDMAVTPFVTSSLPATFISAGNADPLAPQSVELANTLKAKGVEVDSLFFPPDHQPPLGHEYQMMLSTDAGRLAFDRSAEFLANHSR